MSTLNPRAPLTPDELSSLYPSNLQLHLVHVIFRHGIPSPPVLADGGILADILKKTIGERSPVSARFQNTGLSQCRSYSNLQLPQRPVLTNKQQFGRTASLLLNLGRPL